MNLADSEREKCLRYRTGIINSVVAMDSGRRIVTMLDTISSTRYSLDLILLYILKFLFNWFRDFCLFVLLIQMALDHFVLVVTWIGS